MLVSANIVFWSVLMLIIAGITQVPTDASVSRNRAEERFFIPAMSKITLSRSHAAVPMQSLTCTGGNKGCVL